MQPIVAELEKEYAGALEVQFFDVWADPMAGSIYRVETIPTQVFLDEHGQEIFRHHGFYAKERHPGQVAGVGLPLLTHEAMMQTLFGWLGGAVDGPPAIALLGSDAVGRDQRGTEPLSPGEHTADRWVHSRAGRDAASQSGGSRFAVCGRDSGHDCGVGRMTAAAGRLLGDIGPAGSYIVAAVLLVAGLHLTNVLPIPMPTAKAPGFARKGYLAAAMLGLLFGLALGPCTFAFMAAILGVVFRTAGSHPIYAGALLLLYGVGHCAVIAAAGTSASMVQRYLNWSEGTHAAGVVRIACGLLSISAGLWLIYTA